MNGLLIASACNALSGLRGSAICLCLASWYATSANGQAIWIEQGPGPAQYPGPAQVSGAIAAIAADPSDADRVFIASANGGVWRTVNATAVSPTWRPVTDELFSLSMGAIAISPSLVSR